MFSAQFWATCLFGEFRGLQVLLTWEGLTCERPKATKSRSYKGGLKLLQLPQVKGGKDLRKAPLDGVFRNDLVAP